MDARWTAAIAAIDAGDVAGLTAQLAADPALVRERLEEGEGYFARPYLLWFVAENPVRNDALPANIADVARAIIEAAAREGVLAEQVDYALGLVATGRVPREQGVQRALLDALADAGAALAPALASALPHAELDAARHLLARGAPLTLAAAAALGLDDDVARLAAAADPAELHTALMCAAVNARPAAIAALIARGAALDAYGAPGHHSHSTALHQAVAADSLAAVTALVEAGADRTLRDGLYDGTPLAWAEHLGHAAIAAYLRARPG